jgi:hypothetical protein
MGRAAPSPCTSSLSHKLGGLGACGPQNHFYCVVTRRLRRRVTTQKARFLGGASPLQTAPPHQNADM